MSVNKEKLFKEILLDTTMLDEEDVWVYVGDFDVNIFKTEAFGGMEGTNTEYVASFYINDEYETPVDWVAFDREDVLLAA